MDKLSNMKVIGTVLAGSAITAAGAIYLRSRKPTSLIAQTLDESYDYIVVGAGTAGCVLAARLSEDPNVTVLLVEAGGEEINTQSVQVPLMTGMTQRTEADWQYYTVPQTSSRQYSIKNLSYWPRGKILGGSGMLNFMMYTRGNRHDYDEWASLGCDGWSYNDVLPYFLKSEDILINELSTSPYHHKGGPIAVSDIRPSGIGERLVEAGRELGYPVGDYNGKEQDGFHRLQSTVRAGKRSSTAREFLRPAMTRTNLHVATKTHVLKVVLDGNRAIGIDIVREASKSRVLARKEVILSAGAVNSPQILMLSGIGPRKHLESLNIPVVADLPVGDNLQDHLMLFLTSDIKVNESLTEAKVGSISSLLKYVIGKSGYLSSSGLEGNVFVNSKKDEGQKYCDIQIGMYCLLPLRQNFEKEGRDPTKGSRVLYAEEPSEGITMLPMMLHPKSRGTIRLASSDPFDHPLIDPKYLTHKDDVETLIKGARLVEKIFETEAFKKMGVSMEMWKFEHSAEHEFRSDAFWESYIRHLATTIYHPTSTCKMGPVEAQDTVVDSSLKIKGISGLRVVDASIMPNIVSGNTNAPVVMIAEKAVDLITGKNCVSHLQMNIKGKL